MRETESDGGPAFPTPHTVADANDPAFKLGAGGMSLRDHFAGQALSGLLASLAALDPDARGDVPRFARDCYKLADAMLKERDK